MYLTLTSNFKGPVRKDTLEGRSCIVVPMVMLTEGVHEGSGGPLYYPKEELSKTPVVWNHKPVVVYHPTFNGQGVSACDKNILETQKVGVILNTTYEDKLKAEAWLFEDDLKRVDKRIYDAIENNQMMEVSTGLFTDNEETSGIWNTEKYTAVARNYRPDHLAILPDQKGACSIADGAGLLRNNAVTTTEGKVFQKSLQQFLVMSGLCADPVKNSTGLVNNELSFSNISSSLSKLLSTKYGKPGQYWDGWICEVFSNRVIFYGEDNKTWMISYTSSDSGVTLSGEATEVQRVVEYKVKGGKSFTANSAEGSNSLLSLNEKEDDMAFDKKAHVNGLIGNGWEEKDRAWLESQDDAILAKIQPKVAPVPAPVGNATPSVVPAPAPLTAQQFLSSNAGTVPPEILEVLNQGLVTMAETKASLVKTIMANKANVFSEAFLTNKGIPELKGLAAMAQASMPAAPDFTTNGMFAPGTVLTQPVLPPNYAGLAGPVPVNNQSQPTVECLPLPAWGDDKK